MILDIFSNVCLPIVVIMALGFLMDRRFRLSLESLAKLNLYLFVPAFIFVRLTTSTLSDRIGLKVIGFTVCIIFVMGAVSWLVARGRKERIAMQLGTMFYNSGNWGIPLMTLAFPGLGPVVQVFVLTTMNISMFTIGVLLAGFHADDEKGVTKNLWRRLLPILRQPSLYAVAAGLLARRFGNPIDDIVFLWKPLGYLADALVGFAGMTLGVQLSQTKPPKVEGRLAWALGIRLLGGPLTAMALTWLFGFRDEFAAILIVSAASPTAVNSALVAHEFKGDSRYAAAVMLYSTLLATLAVTVLLAVLRAGWIPWAQS